MRVILSLLFINLCFSLSFAQTPASMSSAEIFHAIRKLQVTGSVLYIAAHPDDENTRLLTYLAKERMYRTGYLSLTRGDGGQNLIGQEQGIELGLIRTQELLAARRIDGAEQFFTRAYDFGYSKSTDEAIRIWDKEKILADMVWVIRQFQPDIIITRFPPDNRAGHGHHSASAVLAREAYDAAADSARFSEQFRYGIRPWKAKRLIWNTYNFGSSNTTGSDQFRVDVGGYNALLGKSYGEIASESRSQHKSQGFGVPRQRGQQWEYFTGVAGDNWAIDIMDGINTTWDRVPAANAIQVLMKKIEKDYRFDQPSASIPALVELYDLLYAMPSGYWREQKLKELSLLIEMTGGLYFECSSSEPFAVRADSLHLQLTVINRSGYPVQFKEVSLIQQPTFIIKKEQSLEKDIPLKEKFEMILPDDYPLTQPYWLGEEPHGTYNVIDQLIIGKAESNPSMEALFKVVINNRDFHFRKPVQYKFTDPVKGELYWPMTVVPRISLEVEPKVVLAGRKDQKVNVSVRSFSSFKINNLSVGSSDNQLNDRSLVSTYTTDTIMGVGSEVNVPFFVSDKLQSGVIEINAGDTSYFSSDSYHEIIYDHIPRIVYFDKPVIKNMKVDLRISGQKIGYIKGAGDKVPDALKAMGYEVVFLEENDVQSDKLKELDAVITGIRAYNVHKWLANAYPVLMNYVKKGGVLVVQYNTSSQIGPLKSRISPHPMTISRNRVTEENSEIIFLKPEHPLLNYPNKITSDDFKGWVQERSVYEAEPYDSAFTSILSMHDKDEQERKGSLLVTNYGKGKFIYTGLSLFRQLPAGVPGSYRLLANIISGGLNKKKRSKRS